MKALVYNTEFENHYSLVDREKPKIIDAKDSNSKIFFVPI